MEKGGGSEGVSGGRERGREEREGEGIQWRRGELLVRGHQVQMIHSQVMNITYAYAIPAKLCL